MLRAEGGAGSANCASVCVSRGGTGASLVCDAVCPGYPGYPNCCQFLCAPYFYPSFVSFGFLSFFLSRALPLSLSLALALCFCILFLIPPLFLAPGLCWRFPFPICDSHSAAALFYFIFTFGFRLLFFFLFSSLSLFSVFASLFSFFFFFYFFFMTGCWGRRGRGR